MPTKIVRRPRRRPTDFTTRHSPELGIVADNHVRESQRRGRTRRRPITDSDAHLSATTAQRARVSHGRDLLLSSWSSSGVTAPEAADPLNCYLVFELVARAKR